MTKPATAEVELTRQQRAAFKAIHGPVESDRSDLAQPDEQGSPAEGAAFPYGDPVFIDARRGVRSGQPRMTVRFLMIVIALAAVTIYVGLIAWRTVTYGMRAANHARYVNSGLSWKYDPTALREWHEQMQVKYEYAASHPWLAAGTDPPPPPGASVLDK